METVPANPIHDTPPKYFFDIIVNSQRVGFIHLRVCYSLAYYIAGQIGYGIDEPFRGNSYASKGCFALLPLIKAQLRNKFGIKDNDLLDKAEVEFSCNAIHDLVIKPLPGSHDFLHLCKFHARIAPPIKS